MKNLIQKIRNKISEENKSRLFALAVLIIMLTSFVVVYKNKSEDSNILYKRYRYVEG